MPKKVSQSKIKVRVRFAPSPTGLAHIGSLRTALYNYLFARRNKGDFILRIEDTDQKRFVKGALENLLKIMEQVGLDYDEGVYLKSKELGTKDEKVIYSEKYAGILEKGKFVPYIQSEKLNVYKKYAEQLVKSKKAYYCFCQPERLKRLREEQIARKQPPLYDRYCLTNLKPEKIKENLKKNVPYVIRLKIPRGETIEFFDLIRGKVKFKTDLIDDQILLKSDGYPTYHLANVVDDHQMGITQVIRGEEWLSSAPKHILLYEYLGWKAPQFAHLPLLLNADKTKLSKRQNDVAVEDYWCKGYLKEALLNFVALLGWNPGEGETQEIFSLKELVHKFSFKHIHKGGAVFDTKKLDWINAQWIKRISLDDLYKRSLKFWEQKDFYQKASEDRKKEDYVKKVLTVERERLTKLSKVGERNKFFFQEADYAKKLLYWKEMDDKSLKNNLNQAEGALKNISESQWTKENLEEQLMKTAGDKRGDLLWPLRVALTGEKKSPSPFEVAWVLGKEESLKRIKLALEKI